MKRLLALAACAGFMAQGVWAQNVAQPSFYAGDAAAFHGDSHTLINAIQALRRSKRGRVVDVRFARKDGADGYQVVVQKDGRYAFLHIDDASKTAVPVEGTSGPDWTLRWDKRARLRFDRKAAVSLAQAIGTAEAAHNNAPAIAAGIATSASTPGSDVHAYNVILDVDGRTLRVAVDGTTGEIIANPEALSEWS